MLSYLDLKYFDDKLDLIIKNQGIIMASIDQVNADLDTIKQEAADYIAKRDAIDVTLNQEISDLTKQVAAGTASAATIQTGIDAAFAKAEAAKDALAPPG